MNGFKTESIYHSSHLFHIFLIWYVYVVCNHDQNFSIPPWHWAFIRVFDLCVYGFLSSDLLMGNIIVLHKWDKKISKMMIKATIYPEMSDAMRNSSADELKKRHSTFGLWLILWQE